MARPKIEAYGDTKKIAAKDELILDGEAIETPASTKPESVEQGMVEEGIVLRLDWKDDPCVVVKHQPAIAIYISEADGIVIAQEDGYGDSDQTVSFRPEHAETIAAAILARAKALK
jgi:hypothetical protein